MGSKIPLIQQSEAAECGMACLAMIASHLGYQCDLNTLRKKFTSTLKGLNLEQLMDMAEELELSTRALQCPLDEVKNLTLPCIIHWDMNHYVVLTKVKGNKLSINDPAVGERVFTYAEFSQHYTGIALELTPTSDFEKKNEKVNFKLTQLWDKLTNYKLTFIKLIALSFLLQVFVLINPYYLQWVIDDVLLSHDQDLLVVLAAGFGIVTLISVFTESIRGWLILRISSALNIQMGINVFHHLLRLPMSYFEARHIGDINSRFDSLDEIRERITKGFVEALVDGVMSIFILIIMWNYNSTLALLVVGAVSLYAIVRYISYNWLHKYNQDVIITRALESTHFIETMRSMQTVKLFAAEGKRESIWLNKYANVINSEIKLGKLDIIFNAANKGIFGIENVLIVFLAAGMVIDATITAGMLIAFISYKKEFTQRMASFIEQIILFKVMKLHLERVSDIAIQEREKHRTSDTVAKEDFLGEITLENVSFKYSDFDQWIFKDFNMTIPAGQVIALTGASGCGKTTLMKIMLGLLKPQEGRVLMDGIDINTIGLKKYRSLISAVMQDDSLFEGSIEDNICLFDYAKDRKKMEISAYRAAIHDEIEGMTMGYNTLVGDLGSVLSGGQIQRVFLARAIYKDPQVLFLDEATSNLDVENEVKIANQIKHLGMTRIIIAHRPETIRQSERIIHLEHGKITTDKVNNKQLN